MQIKGTDGVGGGKKNSSKPINNTKKKKEKEEKKTSVVKPSQRDELTALIEEDKAVAKAQQKLTGTWDDPNGDGRITALDARTRARENGIEAGGPVLRKAARLDDWRGSKEQAEKRAERAKQQEATRKATALIEGEDALRTAAGLNANSAKTFAADSDGTVSALDARRIARGEVGAKTLYHGDSVSFEKDKTQRIRDKSQKIRAEQEAEEKAAKEAASARKTGKSLINGLKSGLDQVRNAHEAVSNLGKNANADVWAPYLDNGRIDFSKMTPEQTKAFALNWDSALAAQQVWAAQNKAEDLIRNPTGHTGEEYTKAWQDVEKATRAYQEKEGEYLDYVYPNGGAGKDIPFKERQLEGRTPNISGEKLWDLRIDREPDENKKKTLTALKSSLAHITDLQESAEKMLNDGNFYSEDTWKQVMDALSEVDKGTYDLQETYLGRTGADENTRAYLEGVVSELKARNQRLYQEADRRRGNASLWNGENADRTRQALGESNRSNNVYTGMKGFADALDDAQLMNIANGNRTLYDELKNARTAAEGGDLDAIDEYIAELQTRLGRTETRDPNVPAYVPGNRTSKPSDKQIEEAGAIQAAIDMLGRMKWTAQQAILGKLSKSDLELIDTYNNDHDAWKSLGGNPDLQRESMEREKNATDKLDARNNQIKARTGYDWSELANMRRAVLEHEEAEGYRADTAKFAADMPLPAWIAARGANAIGGVFSLAGMIDAALDPDKEFTKDSPFAVLQQFGETVNATQAETIKDDVSTFFSAELGTTDGAAKFMGGAAALGYSAVSSMADSLIAMGIGKVMPTAGPLGASDVLFGLNAFTEKYTEAKANNSPTAQAMITALGAGVFEALFEHVSIENMKMFKTVTAKTGREFVLNAVKSFASEGMEELTTDLANTVWDIFVNGASSDYYQDVSLYMLAGDSAQNAKRKAGGDLALQYLESFVAGGLAGAGHAAIGMAGGSIGYALQTKRAYANYIDTGSFFSSKRENADVKAALKAPNALKYEGANQKAVRDTGAQMWNRILNAAEAASEMGLKSNEISALLNDSERIKKGEDPQTDLKKARKYAIAINQAVARRADIEYKQHLKDAFKTILTEQGAKSPDMLLEALANEVRNRRTDADGNTEGGAVGPEAYLIKTQTAQRALAEYERAVELDRGGDETNAALPAWYTRMKSRDSLSDFRSGAALGLYRLGVKQIDRSRLNVGEPGYVKADGTFVSATPTGVSNTDGYGKTILHMSDGTQVDMNNVTFADGDTAVIYKAAGDLPITAAKGLVEKWQAAQERGTTTPAEVFASGYSRFFLTGKAGLDFSTAEEASRDIERAIGQDAAKMAHAQGENFRMNPADIYVDMTADEAKVVTFGRGESATLYDADDPFYMDLREGVNYAPDVKQEGLTLDQKAQVYLVSAGLNAKKGRTPVVVHDTIFSGDNAELNGFYDKENNVLHVSLNAEGGLLLRTVAHEMAHQLKQTAPEAWNALRDYVVQTLKDTPMGKSTAYDKKMSQLEAAYTYTSNGTRFLISNKAREGSREYIDALEEEMVSDSCFDVLGNEENVKEFAKQNLTGLKKIARWISDFLGRIRDAIKDISYNDAAVAALRKQTDALERIRDLFMAAIEEANAEGGIRNAESQSGAESDGGKSENATKESRKATDDLGAIMSEARIDALIKDSGAGKRKDYARRWITSINPTDFINLTTGKTQDRSAFDRMPGERGSTVDEYDYVQGLKDSTQTPFLAIDAETGEVIGHEGRHRMRALEKQGVKYAEITVDFADSDGRLIKEMNGWGNELTPISEKTLINQFGTGQTATIRDIIPLNEANRENILAKYGQGHATDNDIVFSRKTPDPFNEIKKGQTDTEIALIDTATESAAPSSVMLSRKTWEDSEYVKEREKTIQAMLDSIPGVTREEVKKYIKDIDNIACMIAKDSERLDYKAAPGRSMFVTNSEYGGSIDASTLCAKRALLTGTFSAIQRYLDNTVLKPEDVLKLRNMMKDEHYIVSCGLCYVEGSRAQMGVFCEEFIKRFKQHYPDAEWVPDMFDVNTPEGVEDMRLNHPDVYKQYENFWNNHGKLVDSDKAIFASQQKPKLYAKRTEYKNEILDEFGGKKNEEKVRQKNLNGGIRIQSFSDFELPHMIDMMQVIMDMSRAGLKGQAYTKVPAFAWALGNTGLKINLSLIAKGVDENGKLIYDDVEGMPHEEAFHIRDTFSRDVGTILVVFDDAQLKAAMADPQIDFIIPFHRSQWKKTQYDDLGLPKTTKDFTRYQNEKFIVPHFHDWRGKTVKTKAANYPPNSYWDFSLSGKENAQVYLDMCAQDGRRPKFYELLVPGLDGAYSLKEDGSTDGYWKLLIDFKMYDNDGNGAEQMPVRPIFNMGGTGNAEMDAHSIPAALGHYKGGHDNFPVAKDVVKKFIEYKTGKTVSDAEVDDAIKRSKGRPRRTGEMKMSRRISSDASFWLREMSRDNEYGWWNDEAKLNEVYNNARQARSAHTDIVMKRAAEAAYRATHYSKAYLTKQKQQEKEREADVMLAANKYWAEHGNLDGFESADEPVVKDMLDDWDLTRREYYDIFEEAKAAGVPEQFDELLKTVPMTDVQKKALRRDFRKGGAGEGIAWRPFTDSEIKRAREAAGKAKIRAAFDDKLLRSKLITGTGEKYERVFGENAYDGRIPRWSSIRLRAGSISVVDERGVIEKVPQNFDFIIDVENEQIYLNKGGHSVSERHGQKWYYTKQQNSFMKGKGFMWTGAKWMLPLNENSLQKTFRLVYGENWKEKYDDLTAPAVTEEQYRKALEREAAEEAELMAMMAEDPTGGIELSRKAAPKIALGMSDEERTEILKGKTITAATYKGDAEEFISRNKTDLEGRRRSAISGIFRDAIDEFGLPESLYSDDLEIELFVSKGTFGESSHKSMIDAADIVRLLPELTEAAKGAVGIEFHKNRYFADTTTVYFANLLGGFIDGDFFVPVRFGIKAARGGRNALYVIISDERIKKSEVMAPGSASSTKQRPGARSDSAIILSQVAKKVKNGDIVKYFPDAMLTDEQKKIKWKAVADTIEHINDRNDRDYAAYIRKGDMGSAARMVAAAADAAMPDSKVRDDSGKLLKLRHGTDEEFTVFDFRKGGGKHGTANGYGIYLTDDPQISEKYGDRQIVAYVDIERPATDNALTLTTDEVKNLIRAICEKEAEALVADDEYASKEEAIRDTWVSNYTYTYDSRYKTADDIYEDVANQIIRTNDNDMDIVQEIMNATAIYDYEAASEFYDDILTPVTGIDGFATSEKFGDGRKSGIWLAFRSEQVKLADPITYDDDGNIIPISERFSEKKDIRFSRKSDNKFLKTEIQESREKLDDAIDSMALGVKTNYEPAEKRIDREERRTLMLNYKSAASQGVRMAEEAVAEILKTDTALKEALREAQRQTKLSRDIGYRLTAASVKRAADALTEAHPEITATKVAFASALSGLYKLMMDDRSLPGDEALELASQVAKTATGDPWGETTVAQHELAQEILGKYIDIGYQQTFGDKADEKIRGLKDKARKGIANEREKSRLKLAEARAEYKKKLKEQHSTDRGKYEERLGEYKEHHKEMMHKRIEQHAKSKRIEQIRKHVAELRRKLTSPTEKKHIPANMLKTVIAALDLFSELDSTAHGKAVKYALSDISDAYRDAIAKQLAAPNEELLEIIDNFKVSLGEEERHIRQLSVDEIEGLWKVIRAVEKYVSEQNKAHSEMLNRPISEMIDDLQREISGKTVKPTRLNPDGKVTKVIQTAKSLELRNLKPVYFFRRFASDTMEKLFWALQNSELGWERIAQESRQAKWDADRAYDPNHRLWYKRGTKPKTVVLELERGDKVTLTATQAASLWLMSKDEGGATHLMQGGFIVDKPEYKKGSDGKYHPEVSDHNVRLTAEDFVTLSNALTEDQKAYATRLQKYLAGPLAAHGNAVTQKLYELDRFTNQTYWPLRSAQEFLDSDPNNPAKADTVSVRSPGFTKARIPHASNPVVLEDMFTVWARHVNGMALYASMTLPLDDMLKVWNTRNYAGENIDAQSVKMEIERRYGKEYVRYMEQFLRDINGGLRGDPSASFINSMLSHFKAAAVLGNFSVALQQPASIGRAMAYIEPKYIAVGAAKALRRRGRSFDEMQEHAPIAGLKSRGAFDVMISTGLNESLIEREDVRGRTAREWANTVLGYGAELGDAATWTVMWEACKAQVKTQEGLTGDALLDKAAELFNKTMVLTQVYDSVFSRSELMRAKDTGVKEATAFNAEPTTSLNMIEDMIFQIKNGRMSKGQAAKVFAGVMTSIILANAASSLVGAVRKKDEEHSFWEKFLASFGSGVADDLTPISYIPVVKDIYSIFKGYGIDRSAYSGIATLYDTLTKVVNPDKRDPETLALLAGAMADLTGLPGTRLTKDVFAAARFAANLYNPDRPTFSAEGLWDAVKGEWTNPLTKTIEKQLEASRTAKLYRDYVNGSDDYEKRYEMYLDEGYTEDEIEKSLRAYYANQDKRTQQAKKLAEDGDISGYKALVEEMAADTGLSKSFIADAVLGYGKHVGDSIYTSSMVVSAFNAGSPDSAEILEAVVEARAQVYMSQGKDAETALKDSMSAMRTAFTSFFKTPYQDALKAGNTDEAERIRQIVVGSGVYADAEKAVANWAKEVTN